MTMLFDFPEPTPRRRPAKPKKEPAHAYSEKFEAAWQVYPRKLNCSKFEASKAFDKLSDDLQDMCAQAVAPFARMMTGKDEQYICHMATWINQRRWETIAPAKPAVPPAPVTIDWPAVLKIYRATGRWNAEFGPEPGMPGYRGPK